MKLEGVMLTKKSFTKMIEATVREKSLSYIDAVCYLCEQHNLDIEDTKKYISPSVTNKIEEEARKLNYLPKRGSDELPVED